MTVRTKEDARELLTRQYRDKMVQKTPVANFFAPFQSRTEFKSQLQAPVFVPIICALQVAHYVVDTLTRTIGAVMHLLNFDLDYAKSDAGKAVLNLYLALCFTAYAVQDTLQALCSLLTRTVGTLLVGVAAGAGLAVEGLRTLKNQFFSAAEPSSVEGQSVDTSSLRETAFSGL